MTTRSATPPDTASRARSAIHEFVTGRERQVTSTPSFRHSIADSPAPPTASVKHRK